MNGREMLGQTSAKQANAQTQARQPKKQAAKRSLSSDGYESREILDSLSLTILSERSQTEYARQRQNSKKKFQKLWATI